MTDPRRLHEADADDRAALLEENRRLSERVGQLEAALRVFVDFGWLDTNQYGNAWQCEHCYASARDSDEIKHESDCPVVLARVLLEAGREP